MMASFSENYGYGYSYSCRYWVIATDVVTPVDMAIPRAIVISRAISIVTAMYL